MSAAAVDAVIMRIADVQLTFPAILIALLVDGVVKSRARRPARRPTTLSVLVFSIGLSFWVQYARTVRGSAMVEKNKDYVAAARLIGLPAPVIMFRHVLPNVLGPGAGHRHHQPGARDHHRGDAVVPRHRHAGDQPSLGTLIRIGNKYLFSGEWWIVAFPGIALALLVLAVNLARRLAARRAQSEAAMM